MLYDNEPHFLLFTIFQLPGPPPLPVRRRWEIYDQLLALIRLGIPMQHPEPNRTLPDAYRRRGITIGDVGILTPFGGFDFMFNICLPADHPINQQGLPEGFSPLFPPLQPSDVDIRTEFNHNTYLTSKLNKKSCNSDDSSYVCPLPSSIDGKINAYFECSGIVFESSDSEGAILALPQGADAENLLNVSRFKRYLSDNETRWYRYANKVRGREARSGDLRLVVGCVKAPSWGMATYANSAARDLHLEFKSTSEGGHRWEHSGSSGVVEARAGPDPRETKKLRATDSSRHLGVYMNQCLFVHTLRATLRDEV